MNDKREAVNLSWHRDVGPGLWGGRWLIGMKKGEERRLRGNCKFSVLV